MVNPTFLMHRFKCRLRLRFTRRFGFAIIDCLKVIIVYNSLMLQVIFIAHRCSSLDYVLTYTVLEPNKLPKNTLSSHVLVATAAKIHNMVKLPKHINLSIVPMPLNVKLILIVT